MNQELKNRWDRNRLRDPHGVEDKKQRVRTMFAQVAGTYDLVNHVLSLNQDHRWRKRAVSRVRPMPGQAILDVCCGTGDMALTFAIVEPKLNKVVGVDFVAPMLDIARRKGRRLLDERSQQNHNGLTFQWHCADAEDIPLDDGRFDRISCVFGIRNLQNPRQGLREMFRLLKPGGRVVILEFAMPENPVIRWLYQCYFRLALPVLGTLISQDKTGAYQYLPQSVRAFDTRPLLESGLRQAGFGAVEVCPLNFGSVLLVTALKP